MPQLNLPIHPSTGDSPIVLGHDPEGAARVRRRLSDLWSEMRASEGDHPSFHRVCLTNFVVVGPASEEQALDTLAAAFAGAHPSRVIMAIVDTTAREMTASISASCQRSPSGGDVVCWEKILIHIPAGCDASLASVVRALLMGRVATVAVVALPADDWPVLIDGVKRWGDLLVSDGSCSLTQQLIYWDRDGRLSSHPRWIERLWEGLKPVRLLLAREYEQEESRGPLGLASEIECAGPDPGVCRLIIGWLATRLGWVILGPARGGDGIRVRRPSGTRVSLRIAESENLVVRYSKAGVVQHEITAESADNSNWKLPWDDPRWPNIVMQAQHSIHADHIFFSAAAAASKIERIQSGAEKPRRVTVADDAAELADVAAQRFIALAQAAIRDRGQFVVALAGGSTPKALYERLTQSPYRDAIDWDKVEWFWGDERWVPHDDPQSNFRMARQALLDHFPAPPERIHPIPTHLDSVTEAAEDYETTIRSVTATGGGVTPIFDLILLGIGPDGHTASWFPDAPLDAAVHSLAWGGYIPSMEASRVTITPRLIGAARCALFLVSGSAKAEIVARTLYPPWEDRHPAARVRLSDGDIEWFLDAHAAARIDPSDFSAISA